MKARTTLKLTSASSKATRTSRSASWMFSSDRRPRPPSRSKMVCSLVLKESNMERGSVRNYYENSNRYDNSIASPMRQHALLADVTLERQPAPEIGRDPLED